MEHFWRQVTKGFFWSRLEGSWQEVLWQLQKDRKITAQSEREGRETEKQTQKDREAEWQRDRITERKQNIQTER